MATSGVIFKRCGFRDRVAGRRLERTCPRLGERGHGSWYFACSTRNLLGRSERVRRGGFGSKAAACRARDELLGGAGQGLPARAWTLERWLRYWLSTRTSIRPTTLLHYTRDVETFLVPHLGRVRLADLDLRWLAAGFARIAATTNRCRSPQSPSRLHHIRTTLRAALNFAVREGVIVDNPARRLELLAYRPPRPRVWTDGQVAQWRATGARPAVAVWTPEQLAVFLEAVTADRLFALWRLVALRGLRRGDAAGLRWCDVDLDRAQLSIIRTRVTVDYRVLEGPPKSPSGARGVALDRRTVTVLRDHRRRQLEQAAGRVAAGKRWWDSGYVFTRPGSGPVHPGYLTQRLTKLVNRTGLPPARLHDLRHGAASLAHQAGADLKTLQELLGHASIVITADTYTSVLPAAQRESAEATARLVLTAARKTRQRISRKRSPQPRPSGAPPHPGGLRARDAQVSGPLLGPQSHTVMAPT